MPIRIDVIYPGLNGPIVRDDVAWFYYYGDLGRHDEHLGNGAIGIATFTPGRLAGQQFEGRILHQSAVFVSGRRTRTGCRCSETDNRTGLWQRLRRRQSMAWI